jgi:hypothetical protein
MHVKFWSENLKGRDHSEHIGIDGKIILERILGNRFGRHGLDASGSGQGPVVGSYEDDNEPLGSIKSGGFLD